MAMSINHEAVKTSYGKSKSAYDTIKTVFEKAKSATQDAYEAMHGNNASINRANELMGDLQKILDEIGTSLETVNSCLRAYGERANESEELGALGRINV